jgi:hypothetical protein
MLKFSKKLPDYLTFGSGTYFLDPLEIIEGFSN